MKSANHEHFWAPLTLRQKSFIGFVGVTLLGAAVTIVGLVAEAILWLV